MADRILTLTPTRARPHRFHKMLESYFQTKRSETNDFVCYVDDDDPEIYAYEQIFKKYKIDHIIGERLGCVRTDNKLVELYNDYDYYFPVGDDSVFRTEGWDIELVKTIKEKGNGWGVANANDLIWGVETELLTAPMISGNLIRALGYMIPPALKHMSGDSAMYALMKGIDRIFHRPDIIIEHEHYCVGKSPLDNTYAFSSAFLNIDRDTCTRWKKEELPAIIERIKKEMMNNGSSI